MSHGTAPTLESKAQDTLATRWRRRAILSGKILIVLYAAILGLMMFFEEKLIYFPTKYPVGNWETEHEDAWFEAQDGTKLHGWYAAHPQPKYHVLYMHGNADYVANLGGLANLYRDVLDANVMVFDYRGYGRSEGSPTEAGVIQDATAAREWLAQRAAVPESEIILVGRSLGGGVATSIATQVNPKALVLQSTFSSLPDVAALAYPWLPVKLVMRNRFDSMANIQKCDCPVFQSHGSGDRLIPIKLAERLHDSIRSPKSFFLIEGGSHNGSEPPAYFTQLREFLDTHCSASIPNSKD